MSDYKQVDEKPVWLLFKKYNGGRIDIVGVYWKEETANSVSVSNLPNENDCFALVKQQVKLFGSMIEKVE